MIVFMLSIMPTEEKTAMNCLYVKVQGDNFIFTARGPHCMKMNIITGQISEQDPKKKRKELPETFMIPIGDVKAFLEVVKSDKSKCKKLQEEDEDKNFVEITNKHLSSFGSDYSFEQPDFTYKDVQPFFEQNQGSETSSFLKPGAIKSLMSGFSEKQIESFYCTMGSGEDAEKLIHYKQKSTGLEAVFICPTEEIEEDEGGEQTSF